MNTLLKKIFELFNPRDVKYDTPEEIVETLLKFDEPKQKRSKETLQQEQSSQQEHKIVLEHKEENALDFRTNLLEAIVKYFKPYYGIQSFSGTIVIWANNEIPLLQAKVSGKTFEEELRTEFQNKQYDALVDAPLIFETKNPLMNANSVEIIKGIFIEIRSYVEEKKEIPIMAKISAVNGMGLLFKYEIVLDGGRQKTYNIGRCEVVRDNGIHINHIAIRDNDQEQAGNNNCVSRMHARIIFNDKVGFCLQALAGGCRPLGGSTTKIIRGDNQDELRDTNTQFFLNDGDFIELGKAVLLKFEIMEKAPESIQAKKAFEENNIGI